MKSLHKKYYIYLLFFGFALILLGIIFTPDVVSKYIKQGKALPSYTVTKVISYQIYTIGAGCFVILVASFFFSKTYFKLFVFPLLLFYLFMFHNIYINRFFPNNIILKTSELIKPWRVLLGKEIVLSDFKPKSLLVVENKKVLKAKYPVIDIHFHLDSLDNINADELTKAMNECGIKKIINLDGAPLDLPKYIREFKDKYPDKFIMFSVLQPYKINEPDFAKVQIANLEKVKNMGVRGLKVTKILGLEIKDVSGKLVAIDDARLDPIWDRVAELGMPVLIHVGDPAAFFTPVDRWNERYEELKDFPNWSYQGPQFPTKEAILSQTENLMKKHPQTIFIMAHMGCIPENLAYLSYLMDKYPNYYVDTAAIINELGRQPFTARKFFIKYQDRILFGTDGGYGLNLKGLWSPERLYRTYFEFFETSNEYFEYPLWGTHNQGRWRIYGIDLPDEVLKKIYYKNAYKLLFEKS